MSDRTDRGTELVARKERYERTSSTAEYSIVTGRGMFKTVQRPGIHAIPLHICMVFTDCLGYTRREPHGICL